MESKKTLILTDTHLGVTNFSQNLGMNSLEWETKRLLKWVLAYAKTYQEQNGVRLSLSYGGDFFQYNNPGIALAKFALSWFNDAAKVFERIFIIPGNHDHRVDGYALDILTEIKNQDLVYVTPESNQFVHEVADGLYSFFLPYYDIEKVGKDYYQFVDDHKDQLVKDKTILIGHLYDEKAKVGSESDLITKLVSEVSFSKLAKYFPIIISGHIHNYQEYVSNKSKIIYPGTMQSFTGHDIGLQKKFMIIDSNMNIEWVETPHTLFIERTLEKFDDVIFSDLIEGRKYLVYLNVKNSLGLQHAYYDWELEQYKNNPGILYIKSNSVDEKFKVHGLDGKELSSSVISFEDIIDHHLNTWELGEGITKEGISKEIKNFVMREAI